MYQNVDRLPGYSRRSDDRVLTTLESAEVITRIIDLYQTTRVLLDLEPTGAMVEC